MISARTNYFMYYQSQDVGFRNSFMIFYHLSIIKGSDKSSLQCKPTSSSWLGIQPYVEAHKCPSNTGRHFTILCLMACPPLISNVRFCLKPSNQMLFNNIGFPSKGGYAMCWHIYKEKEKVVLVFYLPTLRLWTLEVLQIVNAHYFEKDNKSTQGYLAFGLSVRGTFYIFAQIQIRRKCLFFFSFW